MEGMRTLYVRNVPDDVVERIEQLAAREGSSVNAVVVKELEGLARRTRNAEVFDAMPSTDVGTDEILAAIDAGRR
jgi:plasmid stability protein